jgi:putative restriction endonuclease
LQYWWVNQNQTATAEWSGGYLWSPKRNANGHRNPFYEYMREVIPGDLILSFVKTQIPRIGIARSYAYSCPKPAEFGNAGPNWDRVGWKVDVRWIELGNKIRPVEHLPMLRPLFPTKYGPLQNNGRGKQAIYLTRLPEPLMSVIVSLIGHQARTLMTMNRIFDDAQPDPIGVGQYEWEEHLRQQVEDAPELEDTEKQQIILARRGQGAFKKNVNKIEHHCRVTKVDQLEHLRASHIKPWRNADNKERLDGENGLLLTPNIDHLFDRGFISFENDGRLILSPAAHTLSLQRMGIPPNGQLNVGAFHEGQREYLDYHRDAVLLRAGLNDG